VVVAVGLKLLQLAMPVNNKRKKKSLLLLKKHITMLS
jgi:hypothetical protein